MTTSGLALRTMDDVERIARIAVASGYTACRKMEEAAMLVITGQELGLSPAQSLRGIYVVSGKPVLSADLMVAVVRRSGLCASWRTVESTAERCTITTRRQGEEHDSTRTWTMADAKRAGVTGKSTWSQYPAAMLRHRCAADLAREVYPDVLMGLYDPEEMEPAESIPARTEVMRLDSREGLDALDASRQIAAPATIEVFRADVKDCGTLREILTAWQTWAADLARDGAAEDARAIVCQWIADTHDVIVATEVQTLLSNAATVPAAYCALYDALTAAGTVDAAAQAWHGRGALDGWYATAARQMAGRDLKGRGLGRAQVLATLDASPPPDGTDGPSAPRSAADDTATAEGSAAPSSGTHGPVARDDGGAWTLSAKGIRDHVAAITNARHLEASGRAHLREVSPTLKVHALHCYTARLRELSRREERDEEGGTVVTQTPQDVAFARAETWLREGPKDTTTRAPKAKRAA